MDKLELHYSDKEVSAWGGMHLMKQLMDQVGFPDKLGGLDLPEPKSNRGYSARQIVEAFMVSIWCGANRLSHSGWLAHDSTLSEIFGWQKGGSNAPSQSTYSRFFAKFGQARNNEVFPAMQSWFMSNFKAEKITLDLDSTVLTRYGEQDGAEVGYNVSKPGRPSHRPLMAFCEEGKLAVNGWLRSGNTADASGFADFMRETLAVLGEKRVGLLRADGGFYSKSNLDYLEEEGINYVVAVRMYPWIRSEISSIKGWVPVARGIEIGEMQYKSPEWDRPRRMVVVRQKVDERPKGTGRLFEDLPGHRHSCMVTNLDLPEMQVWKLYRGRADCENRIKELKEDFGLRSFCMKDFWATEAMFRMMLAAYNLMALFRLAALSGKKSPQLKTLRFQCYALGAWVSKHARKKVLNLSVPLKKRGWLEQILLNLSGMSIPIALEAIA